jgi:flagellar biosynthetic protein FliQ
VDVGTVIRLGQQAMWMVALVAGPMLAVGLLVGLVVSVLQASTQINEQTLSFVPKMAAVLVAGAVFGPWMLAQLVDFARGLLLGLPGWVR